MGGPSQNEVCELSGVDQSLLASEYVLVSFLVLVAFELGESPHHWVPFRRHVTHCSVRQNGVLLFFGFGEILVRGL